MSNIDAQDKQTEEQSYICILNTIIIQIVINYIHVYCVLIL